MNQVIKADNLENTYGNEFAYLFLEIIFLSSHIKNRVSWGRSSQFHYNWLELIGSMLLS